MLFYYLPCLLFLAINIYDKKMFVNSKNIGTLVYV